MKIEVIERQTGRMQPEPIYGKNALAIFYSDSWVSRLLSLTLLPLIAHCSLLSRFYGYLQTRPRSRKKIEPFLRKYQIDASEFASQTFGSFNDFFIRKLKPACRPISRNVCFPSDGRALVYPNIREADGFYVKGQKFSLRTFLQDPVLANRYANGAMAILRLCPTDYHRFHFPCSGVPSKARCIAGPLYSVNPAALRQRIGILAENRRVITEINHILMVEIGATFVGSIHQTYLAGRSVEKGEEKGYFSFGGSSIVLLFEPGTIQFDDDLIANSSRYFETRVLFGQSLGKQGTSPDRGRAPGNTSSRNR